MIEVTAHLLWDGGAWVAALMLALWLVHLWTGNAAIVDAGWAGGLALLAVLYTVEADGAPARKWLIAGMAAIWGLRLAFYLLFTRIIGHPEEGRYVQLRKNWKTHLPFKFLLFFEFQAFLCVALSLPFAIPAQNAAPALHPLEYSGAAIWLGAMFGEALADAQLHRFKQDPANKGRVCKAGLWKYSRHPNYFFEWLIWVGYSVFALASPGGVAALVSPALILYFLLRVTGIPATEEQNLRGKGDAYREYQRTTSKFIPWPPAA